MIRNTTQDVDHTTTQTVWGLDAARLHQRYWAARGVQIICRGDQNPVDENANLFLMIEPTHFCLFRLDKIIDTLSWLRPKLLFVRIHDSQEYSYREQIITDDQDRFIRVQRAYGGSDCRLIRSAVCANAQLAELWRSAPDNRAGWRLLRKNVAQVHRTTVSINGSLYPRNNSDDRNRFIRELVTIWRRPDAAIRRAKQTLNGNVWVDSQTKTNLKTRFIGPVWVGAGRELADVDSVVGPAVLWDEPDARPQPDKIRWDTATDTQDGSHSISSPRRLNQIQKVGKRAFDIAAALIGLAITLPLYPLIMLIIWLEDGRPFFFPHRRETRGGKEFPCLKFRTMRNDAEQLKQELAQKNKCDGPQFYIEDDPRITRFGGLMRKLNIDELPQFLNVLVGHMSIVGPRPSPYSENQYCPPWREARLSVRPGITGLWQIMRSREDGLDFQEWIRYDIEYVENMSWRMDFWVLCHTAGNVFGIKCPLLCTDPPKRR